jgi:hypothetical protein
MLERLFKDELNDDYKKIKTNAETEAGKKYPSWQVDKTAREMYELHIAFEKFSVLVGKIKERIPQETILEIGEGQHA